MAARRPNAHRRTGARRQAAGACAANQHPITMSEQSHAEPAAPPIAASWSRAIAALDDDLARRDAAARTRSAYGRDVRALAEWATARGLEPDSTTTADVRRWVASLSAARLAPSTSARKLAAARSLFASLRERGRIAQ